MVPCGVKATSLSSRKTSSKYFLVKDGEQTYSLIKSQSLPNKISLEEQMNKFEMDSLKEKVSEELTNYGKLKFTLPRKSNLKGGRS